jgi:integrative and conjugative element protein (TIGR02256 family)
MSSMRFINLWQINEGSYLKISDGALEVFARYAQLHGSAPESGGVLLGYVRDEHIEILEATEPTSHDTRRRFFFLRRPNAHQEIAERRWKESDGLVRYLGEWHTHPEDLPNPSCLDRYEWKVSAKKRKDGRAQVGLIVGRLTLHIELMFKDGKNYVCGPVIEN